VNPLARPLLERLAEREARTFAEAVLPILAQVWCNDHGDFPFDPRSVEAARLALETEATPDLLNRAAEAASEYLFKVQADVRSALDIAVRAIVAIKNSGCVPSPWLVMSGIRCAQLLGEVELLESFLSDAERLRGARTSEEGHLLLCMADIDFQKGDLDALREHAEEAAEIFAKLGEEREFALSRGKIADILQLQGELDEALRIHREEQLPVFERLEDKRSVAITMGKIADVLERRGDVDEALRIRRQEELPVYERLGDRRSTAIAMGRIADILHARGELDEALRIRREEELPVYERLGELRETAVTMGKIADVLSLRGDLDEALRIHREVQLPVFERLGDRRSIAVTMGRVADILQTRG